MKNIFRTLSALLCGIVLIFQLACGGPLSKLDTALDYAPFFFHGLVLAGQITETQSEAYLRGVARFETIADNTKQCLSADQAPDANCYLTMGNDTRSALSEFFPSTNNSKVDQWAGLVNDVVQLIIRKNVSTQGAAQASDDDISKKLDALIALEKQR